MNKVVSSAEEAVADIPSGITMAVGGFGLCGIPRELIDALHRSGAGDLHVVSNNCGVDDWGLGVLLADKRITRMTSSYVGENKEFARQYLTGELEVELIPQGTLAEKLRASGCGIPAFYTASGVDTPVADGGVPWKYHADGAVAKASPRKETRSFTLGGRTRDYLLEESLMCDVGLVHAAAGDRHGNLVFHASARNFNPLCAMASRLTIAQVETLLEPGELDPDRVHLPGVFVQRVVVVGSETEKRIERTTMRPQQTAAAGGRA